MEQISFYVTEISFAAVIVLWFVFAGVFIFRKKPEVAPDAKRAPKSMIGLILQGVGFAFVWAARRQPNFSSFVGGQFTLNIILQILAVSLAAFSVWMAMSAVRELGKQWSLEARLTENHKLITSGVYRIVRHPIYTAMLGMLVSTGIVFSYRYVLIAAVIVFFAGTKIRTIAEEKLLRDAFPEEYKKFSEKVPAFIPFVKI